MIKFTFPSKLKLIKTDDFSSVFNFRKRISGNFLAIHYQYNQLGWPRLGLIVAKKVARHSVDRNYMRRVLRELFRKNQHQLKSVDLVIRIQRSYSHADFAAVEQEFTKLMTKLSHQALPVSITATATH
ncbi:MAG TPA: ribonuclease P protein component [Methylophilaceae bacterium]|nr:ribonuclease P protein component [Methylophilaceae bacterium]